MSKKSSVVAQRAWDLLRELLWERKVDLHKSKVALTFNIFHRLIRKIVHSTNKTRRAGALLYGDHEFSFGHTPVVHVRMHRPKTTLPFRVPCIQPRVDDHDWFDDEDENEGEDEDAMWGDRVHVHRTCFLKEEGSEMSDESAEGIDRKAEEFIAKFYEEMKQQRQISYL